MSYIPARKMPHAVAKPGEFDAESGKIIHLNPDQEPAAVPGGLPTGWIAGAIGAVAAVGAVAALFTLRSSSSRKPARRRARSATAKSATPRRRASSARTKKAA